MCFVVKSCYIQIIQILSWLIFWTEQRPRQYVLLHRINYFMKHILTCNQLQQKKWWFISFDQYDFDLDAFLYVIFELCENSSFLYGYWVNIYKLDVIMWMINFQLIDANARKCQSNTNVFLKVVPNNSHVQLILFRINATSAVTIRKKIMTI